MLSKNKKKKRRKKEKKTWGKKYIRQNAIQLEKQKELESIEEEIYQLVKARWIYISCLCDLKVLS